MPLSKAMQIRRQRQQQRGWNLYSWHAPETECVDKGKAHAKALPGNPYDGQTLTAVIEETETLTGREVERVYVDNGYRGHDAPEPLRVFRSGQKRGVHGQIKKELRRRGAIEAAIGHMKNEGHLGRIYLKGPPRRPRQRRPHRRWLQPPPGPQAEDSLAPNPRRDPRCPRTAVSPQSGFLTVD